MITPAEIIQKAGRLYLPFLRSWVQRESFFPRSFPVGSLPLSDYAQLRDGVRLLMEQSKERRGYGYTIELQVQQTRNYGQQTLPKRVTIETAEDFLCLVDKEREFADFQQDVSLLCGQMPCLCDWIVEHPQRVIEYHGHWPDLLEVCAYFVEHPRPQCYIRELPVRVHTKFIEQHLGVLRELLEKLLPPEAIQSNAETFAQRFGLREEESLVRVRFLDDQLSKRYGLPLTDLCIPRSQFTLLELPKGRCIVTENKMVFLTLPSLSHTFAIFGGGFMVRYLSAVSWLANCPILYWGDLDAHGFEILSLLRSAFPHTVSMMMDEETLQMFSAFCVTGPSCDVRELPYLTPKEHALFLRLAQGRIRLEQEHISHSYASRRIHQYLGEEK